MSPQIKIHRKYLRNSLKAPLNELNKNEVLFPYPTPIFVTVGTLFDNKDVCFSSISVMTDNSIINIKYQIKANCVFYQGFKKAAQFKDLIFSFLFARINVN